MMKKELHVLIVDDSEDDALLVVRRLKNAGYEADFRRVETPEAMRSALADQAWDVIICDYVMPVFSAPEALNVLKQSGLDLPFIVMSGVMGEETAVGMMKAGAHDYIRKDAASRLLPAIEREIADAAVRAEKRHAEELIIRSLREKEVMLKEIHHRVKNNMQVIHSLLNLQAKGIADKAVRAMFEDSRNRVYSMALIHEKLYQSKDLAHVDFKDYLQSLVRSIEVTYKRPEVDVSVDMESIFLDVNTGIPCGLIVNELVSNSFKHAFPEGSKGTISAGITTNSAGNNVLFVADNGIGLPEAIDFRNAQSLGLQLVNVLAGQVHGTIEVLCEGGTRFEITFPGGK